MADSKDVKKLMGKLRGAINSGIELFKKYKEISKAYQEEKKKIRNNNSNNKSNEFEKNIKNKLDKIHERREAILNRKVRKNLTESETKLSNLLNAELANDEKKLISNRNKYSNYERISKNSLVDFNKSFLKYKKEIIKDKKKILSNILKIGTQLRDIIGLSEFEKLIKKLEKTKYEVSNNKTITFKTLMHHLDSARISEEVAKTVKNIDELGSIKNITNRKIQMEIGIKKKEIENLLKRYNNILELLKKIVAVKFPNKEITNNDINLLLEGKYDKDNSKEYQKKVNAFRLKLKKLNIEIKIKMKELKKLEKLS
jgi:hypothetical protein